MISSQRPQLRLLLGLCCLQAFYERGPELVCGAIASVRPHHGKIALWLNAKAWASVKMPCFDGIGQHALCLFSAGEDEYYPRGFWYSKSFVRNKEILWPKKALSEKVLLGFLSYLYREVLIRVLFSRSFGNLLSFVRVIVWVRFMQRPNFRQVRGTFVEVRLCKLFGLRLYMLGSG